MFLCYNVFIFERTKENETDLIRNGAKNLREP